MRLSWIPIYILSTAVGWAFVSLIPHHWRVGRAESVLVGIAVYGVAFHRYVTRDRPELSSGRIPWLGGGGALAPVLVRAALLLALLGVLLYLYHEMRSAIDITWPVLTLAAWSLADSALDRRYARARVPR